MAFINLGISRLVLEAHHSGNSVVIRMNGAENSYPYMGVHMTLGEALKLADDLRAAAEMADEIPSDLPKIEAPAELGKPA